MDPHQYDNLATADTCIADGLDRLAADAYIQVDLCCQATIEHRLASMSEYTLL
jgi:hypothetical protein